VAVLLLATRNPGKLRELRELLHDTPVVLETLADHPELADAEEGSESFEDNARRKAAYAARALGRFALGEDSGLVVDALGGAPGVLSARYAGPARDAAANNRRLLGALRGERRRSARYVCALALARPGGEIVAEARASCEGSILEQPRGAGGFGYDPLFLPAGETRSMAELALAEKGALSHRGRALRALEPALRRWLAGSAG
jgi:XTP/dITP diphosphohydrolase